jgi:ribosomal protein L40E
VDIKDMSMEIFEPMMQKLICQKCGKKSRTTISPSQGDRIMGGGPCECQIGTGKKERGEKSSFPELKVEKENDLRPKKDLEKCSNQ